MKTRDRKFILSILDRNIKNSFGGDGGIEEFRSMWKFDEQETPLWQELERLLNQGGQFTQEDYSMFWAPYVATVSWPRELKDEYDYLVTGENVNLRAEPYLTAKIITRLSYDIVKRNPLNNEDVEKGLKWVYITTIDGQSGYIYSHYLRSPSDYRACFEKVNGGWKMTVLIAGD